MPYFLIPEKPDELPEVEAIFPHYPCRKMPAFRILYELRGGGFQTDCFPAQGIFPFPDYLRPALPGTGAERFPDEYSLKRPHRPDGALATPVINILVRAGFEVPTPEIQHGNSLHDCPSVTRGIIYMVN